LFSKFFALPFSQGLNQGLLVVLIPPKSQAKLQCLCFVSCSSCSNFSNSSRLAVLDAVPIVSMNGRALCRNRIDKMSALSRVDARFFTSNRRGRVGMNVT
jgi:hypothetical protein